METLQVVEVQGILRLEMVVDFEDIEAVDLEDIEADEWDDDCEYLKDLPDEVF